MRRLIALSIIVLLFAGIIFLASCTSSSSRSSDRSSDESKDNVCTEPENPYSSGTAQYKGYEWPKNMAAPVMSPRPSSLRDAKNTTAKRPNTRNVNPRKGIDWHSLALR